jgi:hypothetical protein
VGHHDFRAEDVDCRELFHYSAVDGWENIESCDVIGNSGDKTVVFDALGASGGDFIVQARKIERMADKI